MRYVRRCGHGFVQETMDALFSLGATDITVVKRIDQAFASRAPHKELEDLWLIEAEVPERTTMYPAGYDAVTEVYSLTAAE